MVEAFLTWDVVCTAPHRLAALACVEREHPCLILLDMMMPVMDGAAFAQRLHAHPDAEIAATPIVLLTAVDDVQGALRATQA